VWLQRVHQKSYPVKTIQRTFVRLGLPRLASRKKRGVKPRQLRLFEQCLRQLLRPLLGKEQPGILREILGHFGVLVGGGLTRLGRLLGGLEL
jgi:hypothetical protein